MCIHSAAFRIETVEAQHAVDVRLSIKAQSRGWLPVCPLIVWRVVEVRCNTSWRKRVCQRCLT
jgi:hypothetical protein